MPNNEAVGLGCHGCVGADHPEDDAAVLMFHLAPEVEKGQFVGIINEIAALFRAKRNSRGRILERLPDIKHERGGGNVQYLSDFR